MALYPSRLALWGIRGWAGVELEEGLSFVVGIDLDVLVWDLLFLKDKPHALDEGAEPAGVEFEGLFGLVGFDKGGRGA